MAAEARPAIEAASDVDPVELRERIGNLAESMGIDLFGVASASDYLERFPDKPQPTRFVSDAKTILVIGMSFEPSTVATVLHPDLANLREYAPEQIEDPRSIEQPPGARPFFLFDERTMILQELTRISYLIAKKLRREGWRTFHLPVTKADQRRRRPPFQHMPALYLAGMGTLGLNCCILTPQFGPRAFFTTIITNCPLPTGSPMDEDMCTRCMVCVESCPKGLIDGKGWKNVQDCDCCRTCIAVCPVGEDASLVRSYS